MKLVVLVIGNVIDGIQIVGPFKDDSFAEEFSAKYVHDADSYLVDIVAPEDFIDDEDDNDSDETDWGNDVPMDDASGND